MILRANEDLVRRRREMAPRSEFTRIGEGMGNIFEQIAARAMAHTTITPEERAERDREERERREIQLRCRRESWLEGESGIPKEAAKMILAGEVEAEAGPCLHASGALAGGKRIVLIWGQPGTGKTLGACYAMWSRHVLRDVLLLDGMADMGAGGLFTTAFDFLLVPPWEQPSSVFSTCPVLVLDDLGREPATGQGHVEELIMRRWSNLKTTVITTNLSLDELSSRYDGRVIDRMQAEASLIFEATAHLREDKP